MKRTIYKKQDRFTSSSIKEPRTGRNYFKGDCVLWPEKAERTKLLKKYEDWDLRYSGHAMTFRQVDEWSKFLESKPWQFFATFTTKRPMTEKSARRSIELFCELLSRELHISNMKGSHSYSEKPFEIFWVTEPFTKGKEGVHLHALISLPEYWRSRQMERLAFEVMLYLWQKVTGGRKTKSNIDDTLWNRVQIQSYRGESACKYTTKYLTKHLVDWDYFCTFNNSDENLNLVVE
jgi:hypothetical protein